MSRHAKRTRANSRERHQRTEAKRARRTARQKKQLTGFASGGLLGSGGRESVHLGAGTRIIPARSARG